MKKLFQSNRFWLLLLGGLVLLFFLVSVLLRMNAPEGTVVGVYINQERVALIDLDTVKEPYSFPVTGPGGFTNTIEVEPGRIRVREAGCPDQICVAQGWLSEGGSPIVCLPNTLVIQLEATGGGHDNTQPDAVVGGG